jgi:zinc protease
VVAGDVTPEEVKRLAENTYGKVPANAEVDGRERPQEPQHIAARRLVLKDPRAGNASFHRYYVTPSYTTAKPGEAEALDLLMKIVADGATSRLYRKLVVEDKIAATSGGDFSGWGLDSGAISIYAVAGTGVGLDKIEAAVDVVLDDIRANGVTEAELERAKKTFLADYIYESDSQASLARRYGWGLSVGRSLADVEGWPHVIANVTTDDVKKAAAYLDPRRSTTGWLLPEAAEGSGERVEQPVAHSRS